MSEQAESPVPLPSGIRDRVIRFDRVRAGDILPDPRNPKTHPAEQMEELGAIIGTRETPGRIGWAGAATVRELPDGRLMYADGHGRQNLDPDFMMPVAVTDLTEAEAGEFLYTYDALARLARTDVAKLDALIADYPLPEVGGGALNALLEEMRAQDVTRGQKDKSKSERGGFAFETIVEQCERDLVAELTPAFFIEPHEAMAQFNELRSGSAKQTGGWISLLFNPHRLSTRHLEKSSTTDMFSRREVRLAMARHKIATASNITSALTLGRGGIFMPADFNPRVARDLYAQYCKPGGRVLDPCHGWGGRLIGFAAWNGGSEYVGVDPSPKTSEGVAKLCEWLRGANFPADATLLRERFEDAQPAGLFDCIFTSPPYFDVEQYEYAADKEYDNFDAWRDGFLATLMSKSLRLLAPDGNLILNVGSRVYPLGQAVRDLAREADCIVSPLDAGFDMRSNAIEGEDEKTGEEILLIRPRSAVSFVMSAGGDETTRETPAPTSQSEKLALGDPPVIREHDGIRVVRDDMHPGGTKARCLGAVIDDSADEYVYASPAYGYAQLALALICKARGKKATVFVAKRKERHSLTRQAEAAKAKIVEVENGYLSVCSARARQYCETSGARLMPFGLDDPRIIAAIADVARGLPIAEPEEVWSITSSGVLSRGLQLAWPNARFFGVRVGAEPDAGRAQVLKAPERFEQDAKEPPPFPSCPNYDAKAWRFIKQRAKPGALFWNVA